MNAKKILLALFLLLPLAPSVAAQDAGLTVTYVANEGFLVSSGGKSVLIDALFDNGYGQYPLPSEALRATMTSAASPFERVDAFLVTHDHGDHLYPPYVIEFLEHHPETTFVGSNASCGTLTKAGGRPATTRAIALKLGERTVESVAGLSITALRVRHTGDADGTRAENLAYLVRINGRTILHVGDGTVAPNVEFYRSLQLEKEGLDILFLPSFDLSAATAAFVRDVLKPRHVVAMHVGTKDSGPELEKFRKNFPDSIVFSQSLERRSF